MELNLYQVDAFTSTVFSGNPAAVCPLDTWLPDKTLQSIALENNLSETAFFVPAKKGYHIRWFTPVCEVDLCGHATLASAFVLFDILNHNADTLCFASRSGDLFIRKENQRIVMDFPSQPPSACDCPDMITKAFGISPEKCLASEDYIAVFKTAQEVSALEPDMECLKKLDRRGVIATAAGDDGYDFVLRFFVPKYGVPEDPVTGSAFTQLVPYWSAALDTDTFKARQLSKRGGDVFCSKKGNRVQIAGTAALYLQGKINI